jgi:indole-3-glycerol phosphate synthase
MPTFLETVVERVQQDLVARKRATPAAELESRLGPSRRGRPFSEALIAEGISLIAEMKRSSPSRGPIRPGASVTEVVQAYQEAGASAVSVLTEGAYFGGSLDDLVEARAACELPLLRKDFVVDEYQVLEARAAGADAVLLIVAAVHADDLAVLNREARGLDLDVVVEVHDEPELECALEVVEADVIGINNRDLTDFSVDLDRTFELLSDVPAGKTVVSESGIHSRHQLDELERVGVDAVLVGEGLMRAADIEAAVRSLTGEEPL